MTGALWKGRFAAEPSGALAKLSSSLHFDSRLWPQDVLATRAHAGALVRAGLLSAEEGSAVSAALDELEAEFSPGYLLVNSADEDTHSVLERHLTAKLGTLGAKIHAGRSRNDLVVTDLRLWLKQAIPQIARELLLLQEVLLRRARQHRATLAPGYTHLQRAQPILLAHHLLAHGFALARDFERLEGAYRRADVSCLGAAAFAGTTLPLDPVATARDLGFAGVFDNSADAVASRDFALEFLSAAAILGTQLSRIGEEIVLWTSSEFAFATLDDSFATGSSIMPQKKNPDVAELVRAKSARITADLMHLLGVLKGLPLAYNRDLQEDKEPVFDAADSLALCLPALAGALDTLVFDVERLARAAGESGASATDLAEALVMQGVAFRHAHEAVGKLVAVAAGSGRRLEDLEQKDLDQVHPLLSCSMLRLLTPQQSVNARRSHGGTAPERVGEQVETLERVIAQQRTWLESVTGQ